MVSLYWNYDLNLGSFSSMSKDRNFIEFERECFSLPADYLSNSSNILFFYLDLRSDETIQYFLDQFNFEICSRVLPIKEQIRIRNIRDDRLRITKLFNGILVRYLVACFENSHSALSAIKITRGKFGKPAFFNRSNYSFNSSDEQSILSVAICFHSDKPIGCDLSNPSDIAKFDIENLRDFYKHEFSDIFTDNEVIELDRMFRKECYANRNSQLQILSQYWAIKESLSKMSGYGLNFGLKRYEVLGMKRPAELIMPENKLQHQSLFECLGQLALKPIGEQISGVRNVCFTIPDSKLICSVVGAYNLVKIIKVDAEGISEFIKSISCKNTNAS